MANNFLSVAACFTFAGLGVALGYTIADDENGTHAKSGPSEVQALAVADATGQMVMPLTSDYRRNKWTTMPLEIKASAEDRNITVSCMPRKGELAGSMPRKQGTVALYPAVQLQGQSSGRVTVVVRQFIVPEASALAYLWHGGTPCAPQGTNLKLDRPLKTAPKIVVTSLSRPAQDQAPPFFVSCTETGIPPLCDSSPIEG